GRAGGSFPIYRGCTDAARGIAIHFVPGNAEREIQSGRHKLLRYDGSVRFHSVERRSGHRSDDAEWAAYNHSDDSVLCGDRHAVVARKRPTAVRSSFRTAVYFLDQLRSAPKG